MHVMGRIGFMGLGIALVGCLSGAPVFAADKPIEDRSKIMNQKMNVFKQRNQLMTLICGQY